MMDLNLTPETIENLKGMGAAFVAFGGLNFLKGFIKGKNSLLMQYLINALGFASTVTGGARDVLKGILER